MVVVMFVGSWWWMVVGGWWGGTSGEDLENFVASSGKLWGSCVPVVVVVGAW